MNNIAFGIYFKPTKYLQLSKNSKIEIMQIDNKIYFTLIRNKLKGNVWQTITFLNKNSEEEFLVKLGNYEKWYNLKKFKNI